MIEEKLLYQKDDIRIYDNNEKSVILVGDRKSKLLQQIYESEICSRRSYYNSELRKRVYYVAKNAFKNQKEPQLQQVINLLNVDSISSSKHMEIEEEVVTINLPKLDAISIDLSELDSDQKAIVLFVLKEVNEVLQGTRKINEMTSLRILAGPGSGKTYTLIRKILIQVLLPALYPHYPELLILATTFTNAGIGAIHEKFKKSDYPELVSIPEISTISSLGYYALKEKYPKWKFDIEGDKPTITSVTEGNIENSQPRSASYKNKHKTRFIMSYLDIAIYYKFSRFHIQQKDFERYKDILQVSLGHIVDTKEDLIEFLDFKEYDYNERDVKILWLALERGIETFEKSPKRVDNFVYDKFYSPIVSLAKNYGLMYEDHDKLWNILNKHKSKTHTYRKFRGEITDEMVDNVLKILEISDTLHTIDFDSIYEGGDTFRRYLFDYDDFARIPYIEKILPKQKYDFFLLDEGQDFNFVQYAYIELMRKEFGTVVYFIGDIDQSIYYYSGTQEGIALILFGEDPNVKTFELTYNYRCSKKVAEDYCRISGIDKKYKLPENAIEGVSMPLTYDAMLDRIGKDEAALAPTNADVFYNTVSLIEKDKKVYMRENEFNENMMPIYIAVMAKKETTKDVINYYNTEIRNYEKNVKKNYDSGAEYEEHLETDIEYKKLTRTRNKIFKLFEKLGFVDGGGNVKKDDIFEFLKELKNRIALTKEEADCYSLTFHQSKGLEFKNSYICNIDSLNDSWKNQTEEETRTNNRIALVVTSRAMEGNYYVTLPEEGTKKSKKKITNEVSKDIDISDMSVDDLF